MLDQPMRACHADIDQQIAGDVHPGERFQGFLGDAAVTRTGCDDENPPHRCLLASRQSKGSPLLIVDDIGELPADALGLSGTDAGGECRLLLVPQPPEDLDQGGLRLARSVDDLREAATAGPVEIKPDSGQRSGVVRGRGGEPGNLLRGRVRRDRAPGNRFKQLANLLVSQTVPPRSWRENLMTCGRDDRSPGGR